VAFQFFFVGFGPQEMRMQNTERGVSYGFDAIPSFYSNDSRFYYFLTRGGMRLVSSAGVVQWTEAFSLTRPMMIGRGDMVAVSEEERGRIIYVFGPDGLIYYETFEFPIMTFSVNENGTIAVVLLTDTGYSIRVYNRNRHLYSKSVISPLIHPTAVDVSADDRYIVIAFLDLTVRINSWVEYSFINLADARGTEDGLFADVSFPDQVVYHLRFMSGGQLLVASDTQIVSLERGQGHSVSQRWAIELNNRIDQLDFYGDSRFAFVTGDPLPGNWDAAPVGNLLIFNMNGDETGSFPLGRRATYLRMGHNSVIVGSDRVFHAVNHRGVSLWEFVALQDARSVLFLENTDTILVAGATRADVWRRQRVRNEDIFSE